MLVPAERFEEAQRVIHAQALRFAYPDDGPLANVAGLASSGDWMQGPFSDSVRATVTSMLRYVGHLSEEWDGLARALNRAATEAEASSRMEAVGLAPTGADPVECLLPYRSWEPGPWRLDPGWAQSHGRGSGHLYLDPNLARSLANHLRDGSEAFVAERRRFAQAMEPFDIQVPYALTQLADAAWEIADEIERRVSAYERADEEIARSARALVQSRVAPLAGVASGTVRGKTTRLAVRPRTAAATARRPLFVTSVSRLEKGRNLSPRKRFDILTNFFSKHGGEKNGLGYGEALNTFMKWENKSGRLDPKFGHPWWKAVNGSMMVDIGEAQRLLAKSPRARSENPAVQAWIAFATSKKDRQKKLWQAHQVSLHSAVRAADQAGLYSKLPQNEQRFVEQVVENVDLTAIGNMRSGSIGKRDVSGTVAAVGMEQYLDRVYPDGSVATEADLQRVEDWATPGILMDPGDIKLLEAGGAIGMGATLW